MDVEAVKEVFNTHDTNGDGTIPIEELSAILTDLNPNFKGRGTNQFLALVNDVNADGKVSFNQFMDFLATGVPSRPSSRSGEKGKRSSSKQNLIPTTTDPSKKQPEKKQPTRNTVKRQSTLRTVTPSEPLSMEEKAEAVAIAQHHSAQNHVEIKGFYEVWAGSTNDAKDAWSLGTCVVTSGHASIVAPSNPHVPDSPQVVLARLQKGNMLGFGHCTQNDLDILDKLKIGLVVEDGAPLRVCVIQVPDDRINDRAHFEALDDTTRVMSTIWLSASPAEKGIGYLSWYWRPHFQIGLWGPLVMDLEEHEAEIKRRIESGYRKQDSFPLGSEQIAELKDYVHLLTEHWYGASRGNYSALYHWFLRCMETMGVTAYSMNDIPIDSTSDGWAHVVDAKVRAATLKVKMSGGDSGTKVGELAQKQGRSAIDNTSLVNVFTALEAKVMLIGRRLRKFFCVLIAARQRIILRKISKAIDQDLLARAGIDSTGRDHRVVRATLGFLNKEDFLAMGVNPDESFCLRELLARGSVCQGFNQLELQDQISLWTAIRDKITDGMDPEKISPSPDTTDGFEQIVLWARANPGEYWKKDKLQHNLCMVLGIWSNKLILVKKSAMERLSLARYFALVWERRQPLLGFHGGQRVEMRCGGTTEQSRVRANEAPYAYLHGMSLPPSGFALDERWTSKPGFKKKMEGASFIMEMQWVQDPSANVENWFLTDIEKIVNESFQLNPRGPKSMWLDSEMCINVGQNPKIGSSIAKTQHTQICRGGLSSYPILQMSSPSGPRESKKLGAFVDLVPIGPAQGMAEDQFGCFIKILALDPTSAAVTGFLVELREHVVMNFGGITKVDFLCLCTTDEKGGFVVLFAPIPQLEQITKGSADLADFKNPLTGQTTEEAGIKEARLDFGKGVGQFLCLKPELRDQLLASGEDTMRRIWAFNRVPGLKDAIEKFCDERGVFV